MSKTKKLPKWVNVYPQGTKAGDEEQKFFIALGRHPKYEWRTVAALSKETGLSKERADEIMSKYHKKGMVFNNSKNEDQWAYWERVPHLVSGDPDSLTKQDHNERIDKVMGVANGGMNAPQKKIVATKSGQPVIRQTTPTIASPITPSKAVFGMSQSSGVQTIVDVPLKKKSEFLMELAKRLADQELVKDILSRSGYSEELGLGEDFQFDFSGAFTSQYVFAAAEPKWQDAKADSYQPNPPDTAYAPSDPRDYQPAEPDDFSAKEPFKAEPIKFPPLDPDPVETPLDVPGTPPIEEPKPVEEPKAVEADPTPPLAEAPVEPKDVDSTLEEPVKSDPVPDVQPVTADYYGSRSSTWN